MIGFAFLEYSTHEEADQACKSRFSFAQNLLFFVICLGPGQGFERDLTNAFQTFQNCYPLEPNCYPMEVNCCLEPNCCPLEPVCYLLGVTLLPPDKLSWLGRPVLKKHVLRVRSQPCLGLWFALARGRTWKWSILGTLFGNSVQFTGIIIRYQLLRDTSTDRK